MKKKLAIHTCSCMKKNATCSYHPSTHYSSVHHSPPVETPSIDQPSTCSLPMHHPFICRSTQKRRNAETLPVSQYSTLCLTWIYRVFWRPWTQLKASQCLPHPPPPLPLRPAWATTGKLSAPPRHGCVLLSDPGRLVGCRRVVCWLMNSSVGRSVGWLNGWSAAELVVWLFDWSAGWFIGWMVGWMVGWLVGWSTGWLVDW